MSQIGDKLSVTVFGESHGPAIGAVIEGLPAGFCPDMDAVKKEMARRAPKDSEWSTRRKEADAFECGQRILRRRADRCTFDGDDTKYRRAVKGL